MTERSARPTHRPKQPCGPRGRVFTAEMVEEALGPEFVQAMSSTAGGGRWTAERWSSILHARYLGLGHIESALQSGVAYQTVRNWRNSHEILGVMYDSAAPRGAVDLIERLDKSNDPRDCRWRLERRSESFAPPVRRVEEKHAEPVTITFRGLTIPADSIPVPPEISGKFDDDYDSPEVATLEESSIPTSGEVEKVTE